MPELTTAPAAPRRPQRPSIARTLVVLLLVFVFAVSALLASGALDDGIDASEASTRILTPEEIQQMAEDSSSASRSGEESAPVALIAALFLVSGMLLISLAVPTRAERRRAAAAPDVPAPKPAPRRQMGAGIPEPMPRPVHVVSSAPAPAPAYASRSVFARTVPSRPIAQPPVLVEPVPVPVPDPPIERRYRAGAIMR